MCKTVTTMKNSLIILVAAVVALQLFSAHAGNVEIHSQVVQVGNSSDTVNGNLIQNLAIPHSDVENGNNVSRFFDHVRNATKEILQEANDYREQIGENIRTAVQDHLSKLSATVQAFRAQLQKRIKNLRSRVKRRVLNDIVHVLQGVDNSAHALEDHVHNFRTSITKKMQKEEITITDNWNKWGNKQIDFVANATNNNQDAMNEVEGLIIEFINRFSTDMQICTNKVEDALQAYEDRVLAGIEHYQTVVDDLLKQTQNCLDSNDSSASSLRCESKARPQIDSLSNASADIAKLIESSLNVLKVRSQRRICILRILREARLEQHVVERKVKLIEEKATENVIKTEPVINYA